MGVGVGAGIPMVNDDTGPFIPRSEVVVVAGDATTPKGQKRRARRNPNRRLYKIAMTMMAILIANGVDNDRAFADAV